MKKFLVGLLIIFLSVTNISCVKKQIVKSEKKNIVLEKEHYCEKYLIPLADYTSKGGIYHQKYHQELLNFAMVICNKFSKIFTIHSRSIGFYYDNKTGHKNALFLGVDLELKESFDSSILYTETALDILTKNLEKLRMMKSFPCDILDEKEILGIVCGFYWLDDLNQKRSVTIWIQENDFFEYCKGELSIEKIIKNSTLTDSDYKVIEL